GSSAPTSAKHVGEDVAKTAASRVGFPTAATPGAFEHIGEVKAAEVEVGAATARSLAAREPAEGSGSGTLRACPRVSFGGRGIDVVGIEAELVVNLALLRIAQYVVGFRDCLELFFCSLIPRVDVRVVLARQFAERLAYLVS